MTDQPTSNIWAYICYDKNGVWCFRAPVDDILGGEINLEADWPDGIPLVSAQRIGTWTVPATRMYSVQEIINEQ